MPEKNCMIGKEGHPNIEDKISMLQYFLSPYQPNIWSTEGRGRSTKTYQRFSRFSNKPIRLCFVVNMPRIHNKSQIYPPCLTVLEFDYLRITTH